MKRTLAIVLALIMCVALFAGCANTDGGVTPADDTGTSPADVSDGTLTEDAPGFTTVADSYDALYQLLSANASANAQSGTGGMATSDTAAGDPVMGLGSGLASEGAPVDSGSADTAGGDVNYSGTNVQVDGYDEADIVKTDGKYIYILRDGELCVTTVNGTDVTELSTTSVCAQDAGVYEDTKQSYSYEWCQDMYLYGSYAIIMRSGNSYNGVMANDIWTYEYDDYTYADVYDVSNPYAPSLVQSIGQEGSYNDSRFYNGMLYLVTNCYKQDIFLADDTSTFVPRLYDGQAETVMPVSDIIVCQGSGGSSYVVLSSINMDSFQRTGQAAVSGSYSSGVYMNDSGIYLAVESWQENETPRANESVYRVVDVTAGAVTGILRYDTTQGGIDAAGSGVVAGSLLNQFSMDEYNGYFRVVTTENFSNYTVYYDDQYGFENYVWGEGSQTNSLYVLDETTMTVVGSVGGLGEDERVYSARFDGDVGYFVTYRQTDPLFAVDLTDPANPTVMSALKIPGFSQYLHVYGENLLLGIGMSANEDTGRTESMKLSMFDTSDKFNVTEAATLDLTATYADALYNHHAVFIDTENNLFGFATWDGYELFSYVDGQFVQVGGCGLSASYNVRGLTIGDYFFVVEPDMIHVLDMTDFSEVNTVALPRG